MASFQYCFPYSYRSSNYCAKAKCKSSHIAIAFKSVTAKVGRAITIWEAILKRSHEPIYKYHTKIEAQRLRATNFAIAKLEER
jgi:hypothetical protein